MPSLLTALWESEVGDGAGGRGAQAVELVGRRGGGVGRGRAAGAAPLIPPIFSEPHLARVRVVDDADGVAHAPRDDTKVLSVRFQRRDRGEQREGRAAGALVGAVLHAAAGAGGPRHVARRADGDGEDVVDGVGCQVAPAVVRVGREAVGRPLRGLRPEHELRLLNRRRIDLDISDDQDAVDERDVERGAQEGEAVRLHQLERHGPALPLVQRVAVVVVVLAAVDAPIVRAPCRRIHHAARRERDGARLGDGIGEDRHLEL